MSVRIKPFLLDERRRRSVSVAEWATLWRLLLLLGVVPAHLAADVALLVGEPFGRFGAFNPTGHAAVYLSRICAATPTELRRCEGDETGVVISRYHRIGGYDWIAMPLMPCLYAAHRLDDVPSFADAEAVARRRDMYRRLHLQEFVPDAREGEMPPGDWVQLIGAAYDRNLYGFALPTTQEQDDRLIQHLNSQRNQQRFHLLYRNCAEFARDIINFYYPRAIGRSLIADLGISTPKQAARRLVQYARRRNLPLVHLKINQIPGGLRSTTIRGVNESLIRSKKYVVPLVLLQPWAAVGAATGYLTSGRFNPSRQADAQCVHDL